MVDLRRSQMEQILMQAKQFLKAEPIPRQHSQIDVEKSFTTPAFGDAPEFDDFMDTKDKKGKKYLDEISSALDRCKALLQAVGMYSDIRSEQRSDVHRELLNRKDALIEELERFGSHNISLDEKQAFGVDARSLQDFVQIRGFGMDKPLPTPKLTSKKAEQELSGTNEEIVQCKRCAGYVKISGVPPDVIGRPGPKLLVPEQYCPICGHVIGRGSATERVGT